MTVFQVRDRCKRLFRCGNSCGNGVDLPAEYEFVSHVRFQSNETARAQESLRWEGERVLKRFVSDNYAGGRSIAKPGVRCVQNGTDAITSNLRETTADGESAGRQPKMRA